MNKLFPKISVICSGIRSNSWKRSFRSLSKSKLPFEFVVAGHIKPHQKFPENFRHIYTTVKPAQCVEIAARHARGELIMITADDYIFSDKFLDKYFDFYKKNCSPNDIASSLFKRNGKFFKMEDYQFWSGIDESPLLPQSAMMKRELWYTTGGIDKKFIAVVGDIDLTLRIIQNGGKVKFCKDVFVEEIMHDTLTNRLFKKLKKIFISEKNNPSQSLFPEYGQKFDMPTMEKLWLQNKKQTNKKDYLALKGDLVLLKKRKSKPERFLDKDLLIFSQGPKGKWT